MNHFQISNTNLDVSWQKNTSHKIDNSDLILYYEINDFKITNNSVNENKTINVYGPTIVIDIDDKSFFHFLIFKVAQYFILKQYVPDIKILFISFKNNLPAHDQYKITIINWLIENGISSNIFLANKTKEMHFKNIFALNTQHSLQILDTPLLEMIDKNHKSYIDFHAETIYQMFKEVGLFINKCSGSTQEVTSKKVVIFPSTTFKRIQLMHNAYQELTGNNVTRTPDGEISSDNDYLSLLLHNSEDPGAALSFIKTVFDHENDILYRNLPEDFIQKLYGLFVSFGYTIINDDEYDFDDLARIVATASSLVIFAGSSLIWTGVANENCKILMIDPYQNEYVFPHNLIFKLVSKGRTSSIIRDRELSPEFVPLDRLLNLIRKEMEGSMKFNIVIPMAGQGSRFKNSGISTPKPLIKAGEKTLVEHAVATLGLNGHFVFITRPFDNQKDNDDLTGIFKTLEVFSFAEVMVAAEHFGAAHSANFSKNYINKDLPLIITNCDQHMRWDATKFIEFIKEHDPDGIVVVTKSNNPAHSYAVFNDKLIISKIAEKKVISEYALTGIHYWKDSGDFYRSFFDISKTYEDLGYPEAYVSITYNELIRAGKKIMAYIIPGDEFIPIGTPEEVERFNG